MQRVQLLARAFSPSAPIDQQNLFSGRIGQLVDVMNAIAQKGQHAILFGERGVGKTSLARVISAISKKTETIVASINCEPTMTFSSLWKQILREISLLQEKQSIGFNSESTRTAVSMSSLLPDQVSPDDIRHILTGRGKFLIVIDELDRIEDKKITALLADTIKTLSDHAVDVTLLLVGVADSVISLVEEHLSVERALVQIRMPRMSTPELHNIIDAGLSKAEMTITDDAKDKIAVLSQGLPHYTHLLAQIASQRAAQTGRTQVESADVRYAIDMAVSKAQQSIVSAHLKATVSPRENMYPEVLLSCALSKPDELGYFASVDVRGPLSNIMNKQYEVAAFAQHLNAFCEESRGPVLQKTGTARRYRFRFINPLLQPYVIMDGIRKGLISANVI